MLLLIYQHTMSNICRQNNLKKPHGDYSRSNRKNKNYTGTKFFH